MYLYSLSLASTSRSLWGSIEVEVEGTDQSTIAAISEWSDDQPAWRRRRKGKKSSAGSRGRQGECAYLPEFPRYSYWYKTLALIIRHTTLLSSQ